MIKPEEGLELLEAIVKGATMTDGEVNPYILQDVVFEYMNKFKEDEQQ